MAKRDIILVGGSAGGIEACCEIIRELPSDLPASVFVVQHVGSASALANVLARCGRIKVETGSDGERIKKRRIYVAPGDHHMLLKNGHVTLSRGARENRQRPSVDALFRSAARVYRSRVIAVILSGSLDDGAAGVFAVKQRGGLVVVQDPSTALFSSMPRSALRATRADHCVPLSQIAGLLVKLVREEATMTRKKDGRAGKNLKISRQAGAAPFVCPDCSGPLFQDREGPPGQLKCLVGHSFAPESLSEAHRDALERALLITLRLLEERAGVHRHLASTNHPSGNSSMQAHFRECADTAARDAVLLREILERI